MQLLHGGGLMYQPASVDVFDSPLSGDVSRYYRGATLGAEEKIKLFKAAAELAVSGFGGRHELYERFYSGDPFILRVMTQYQSYDKSEAVALARKLLDGYDVETVLEGLRAGNDDQAEALRRGAAR
jgi:aromatic ring hydroxylase